MASEEAIGGRRGKWRLTTDSDCVRVEQRLLISERACLFWRGLATSAEQVLQCDEGKMQYLERSIAAAHQEVTTNESYVVFSLVLSTVACTGIGNRCGAVEAVSNLSNWYCRQFTSSAAADNWALPFRGDMCASCRKRRRW